MSRVVGVVEDIELSTSYSLLIEDELAPPWGGAIELSAETGTLSVTHHPFGSPSGPGLFHVKGLQLPAYIQNIAHALVRSGHPESRAIQMAIGICQRWAAGGGKVTPEVRAAAQKAIAEWEAAKARAHSSQEHSATCQDAIELAAVWTAQLHPRAAGGKFGSKGGQPATAARQRNAGPVAPVQMHPGGPQQPGPGSGPTDSSRAGQLHFQAAQDRHLAHQLMRKANELKRQLFQLKAGTTSSKAGGSAAGAAGPAKPGTGNKTPAKAKSKSSTKTASKSKHSKKSTTKQARMRKLAGQIRSLNNDARALLTAADKLDAQARNTA